MKDFSNKLSRLNNSGIEVAKRPINQTLIAFLVAVSLFGGIWLFTQHNKNKVEEGLTAPEPVVKIEKKAQITMRVELPKKS